MPKHQTGRRTKKNSPKKISGQESVRTPPGLLGSALNTSSPMLPASLLADAYPVPAIKPSPGPKPGPGPKPKPSLIERA